MPDSINPTTKQAIDDKLGQGTVDKLQGKAKELLGSARTTLGNLTNDDELRAKGAAQESEGVVQNTVGKAKAFAEKLGDKLEDATDYVRDKAHDAREKAEEVYEQAKDKAESLFDQARDKAEDAYEDVKEKFQDGKAKVSGGVDAVKDKLTTPSRPGQPLP